MAGCELGAGTFINDTLPEEKAAELRKYTEALLSAVPQLDPETKMKRIILPGEVANPADLPSGCYFHPRCNYAKKICETDTPKWEEVAPEHFLVYNFAKEIMLKGVD